MSKIIKSILGLCLSVISFFLLYLSYSKQNSALSAWFAIFGLIFIIETQKKFISLPIVFIVIGGAITWAYLPMINFLPVILQVAAILGYNLLKFIPFALYSFLSQRSKSIWKSILFGSLFTLSEFVSSLVTPFGTWSSIAYSQFDWKISQQIISIGGLWILIFSIAFVNGLLAETLLFVLDRSNFTGNLNKKEQMLLFVKNKQIKALILILLFIFSFGLIRLSIPHQQISQIRVMTVVNADHGPNSLEHFESIFSSYCPIYQPDIVANNEYGFYFDAFNKNDVFSRFENACQTYNFDLCLAGKMWGVNPSRNQLWWFTSEGNMIAEYYKHYLIPGIETDGYFEVQPGIPPVISVKSVQVSSYICFDGAFSSYVNFRVPNSVDLVIQPSFDWEEIDPSHSKLATFRAVENGYALIKPTYHGTTIACDAFGNEIQPTKLIQDEGSEISIYDIPIYKNFALYKWVGDFIILLNIFGILTALEITRFPIREKFNVFKEKRKAGSSDIK